MMRYTTKYLKMSLLMFLFTTVGVAQNLTVISYNIRYNSQSDGEDIWDLRKGELVGQINQHSPDSFGVQEATQIQMQYILEALPEYAYVGVGRDNGATKGEYSAVFYLKEKFKLLESKTFWLSETPEEVSVGWDAALPRICTYAQLKEHTTGRVFWHFNTHFDHVGKAARANSALLIIEKIKSLVSTESVFVLTGDFNASPNELPITHLKNAFRDPLEYIELSGPEGTFNAFNLQAPLDRRIDYIFFQGLTPLSYAHLSEKRANGRWISDHLPVKFDLAY
ncbi:MAG: endonuclease/exonuclease/phosphatase family protein [Flavobacteriaceae bacterium]|nr:endonuclease/exonuclease/phosphatase family protein [Flavobacteriaceae bacterium]